MPIQKRIFLALFLLIPCLLFAAGMVYTQQQLQKAKVEAMRQEEDLVVQYNQCQKEVAKADDEARTQQKKIEEKHKELAAAKQAEPRNQERLKALWVEADTQETTLKESYKQKDIAQKNLVEAERHRAMGAPATIDIRKWENRSVILVISLACFLGAGCVITAFIIRRDHYQGMVVQPPFPRGNPTQIEARLQTLETLFANMEARLQAIETLLMENKK